MKWVKTEEQHTKRNDSKANRERQAKRKQNWEWKEQKQNITHVITLCGMTFLAFIKYTTQEKKQHYQCILL